MSYTSIYLFDKDSKLIDEYEIKNAHRGAYAVWRYLEKKYLPVYDPHGMNGFDGYESSRLSGFGEDKAQEVWDLWKEERLSVGDRIAMLCTFDRAAIKVENAAQIEFFFREFEGDTSLSEQADILNIAIEDGSKVSFIAFNQTSVGESRWFEWVEDEENDDDDGEYVPYNFTAKEDHFWVVQQFQEQFNQKSLTP